MSVLALLGWTLLLPRIGALSVTPPQDDAGLRNMRRLQGEARANRIAILGETGAHLQENDAKALTGLLHGDDPYDASHFTAAHRAFKDSHNTIFAALAEYCCSSAADANLFYLDGANGGTTRSLLAAGFGMDQLYSANLFDATVEALRTNPATRLKHIVPGRAEDALAVGGCFAHVPFAALYIDGCGGTTSPVIAAIDAAMGAAGDQRGRLEQAAPPPKMAVGFTLTLAEPTGRALSDREQDVVRAVVAAARRAGYAGPVRHVGDEPERYGVDPATCKREQGTLTTWLIVGDDAGG